MYLVRRTIEFEKFHHQFCDPKKALKERGNDLSIL